MAKGAKKRENAEQQGNEPAEIAGNFVSEWFGHRVYPNIVSTEASLSDQRAERCPFLTKAIGEPRPCVKAPDAKGVCTISCVSNGPRQDWLVCPYRALNDDLVSEAIRRLFSLPAAAKPFVTPAATLKRQDIRDEISTALSVARSVFIYFDKKTGGELSIPSTPRSPEFSFDVTVVEVTLNAGQPHIGRFGILEIQTMDFHGSYRHAVRNLREALRMHPDKFGATVQGSQWWLSDQVEGPNIANVFKRTFYQMMFKFGLAQHERCAGCVLAIPKSVWDSWQRHLGAPALNDEGDGTLGLLVPGQVRPQPCPAWIYVFDPDSTSYITPSPIERVKLIGTDARAMAHWALEVAPAAALSNITAETGFLAALSRRLRQFWPELAKTIVVDVPAETAGSKAAKRPRKGRATIQLSLEDVESKSSYIGPTDTAVTKDDSDES